MDTYHTIKKLVYRILIYCFFLFHVAVIVISCAEKKDAKSIFNIYKDNADTIPANKKALSRFLYSDKNYDVICGYKKNGNLEIIRGFLFDKNYGHLFKFDSCQNLNSYQFSIDESSSSYYLLKTEDKWKERGNPFVDYWRKEIGQPNSGIRSFVTWFSDFPRTKLSVSISTDGKHYLNYPIEKSTLMPLLEMGGLSIDSTSKDSIIFFRIQAKDLLLPNIHIPMQKTFYDTLYVNRDSLWRKSN